METQMNTDKARKYLRSFTLWFILWIGSIALFFVIAVADKTTEGSGLEMLLLAVLAVGMAACAFYYIYLGILASHLGRSVIIWVGLPIVTGPLGVLVSFFWMRSLVKENMRNSPVETVAEATP
jgi:hypothetical protein